jgi:hypothetical protein
MSVMPETKPAALRTGMAASATPPKTAAVVMFAVVLTPALATRSGNTADRRSSRPISMMLKSGLRYLRVRGRRVPDVFLGDAFCALVADFAGRALRDDEDDAAVAFAAGAFAALPSKRWLSWCTTSADPPIPSSTGQSTRPVAPTAARASTAAGVE